MLVALAMVFSEVDAKGASNEILSSISQFIDKIDEGFELLEVVGNQVDDSVDFVFIEVNPAFENLTGLKAANIVGRHKKDVNRAVEQRWYEYAIKALKTGKTFRYEYFNNLVNRYLETQFIPISNNRIAVLFKDVTERKKSESALINSEERLRIYLETTPTAVFVADPDGKYLFVNEGATKLLNYSKKELLSMNIPQIIHEDDLENGISMFYSVKQTGKSRGELCLKRKDGSKVNVIITATKLPDGNLIANCEDITELKKLEEQLQAKERLATIGSTAGMVGHDIRNPLQAIVGDVFLLKDYLSQTPQSEVKKDIYESLNGIEKNVNYVNKIVADLQDFARPLNPEYSIGSLSDLINESLKTVDLPDNVNLQIKIQGNPAVKTDLTFVQRALTNIVNNAIQAMPNGGKLTIQGTTNQKNTTISVEDTGIGIAKEMQPKLFTPLTTTKAKGQGLGLAVVKRLIETLNGRVYFESEAGKGTKFTIELPNA
jgi:PAS domain S-box-containing protein